MVLLDLILEHCDRQVMATGAENRILDILDRPKKLNVGLLAGIQSLDQTWDAQ